MNRSILLARRFVDDFEQQSVNVLGRIVCFKKLVSSFVDAVDQQVALEARKLHFYFFSFIMKTSVPLVIPSYQRTGGLSIVRKVLNTKVYSYRK